MNCGRTLVTTWLALTISAAAAEDPPKPVRVVTAELAPLTSRLELTGSVTAKRQAQLSARTGGLVRALKVDAGDVVRTGDVLMELDDDLIRLALARVSVERERAELESAEAKRLLEEARKLAASGAFPLSEAETRENALKVRSAQLRSSEVQESEQKALVERHRLLAPFDGVISQKLTEVGEWVETGTPVVRLVETGSLWMDVQGPQELFARLQDNPEVTVALDAFPDVTLTGKIAVKVPVKDPVARTFLIRIEMDDPKNLAAPGMSGRVIFAFRSQQKAVQVPRDAVLRFPDGSTQVWIVEEANGKSTAASRTVTLGEGLGKSLEIKQGLEAGANVVLLGNEGLREGQAVEILPALPGGNL